MQNSVFYGAFLAISWINPRLTVTNYRKCMRSNSSRRTAGTSRGLKHRGWSACGHTCPSTSNKIKSRLAHFLGYHHPLLKQVIVLSEQFGILSLVPLLFCLLWEAWKWDFFVHGKFVHGGSETGQIGPFCLWHQSITSLIEIESWIKRAENGKWLG